MSKPIINSIYPNNTVIDPGQAGFIPGRFITDNILLSHDLVKGYTKKGISPRWMLKIYMQKAYDSIEWPFLEQILISLNFPSIFVGWVMTCVNTVYHILSL